MPSSLCPTCETLQKNWLSIDIFKTEIDVLLTIALLNIKSNETNQSKRSINPFLNRISKFSKELNCYNPFWSNHGNLFPPNLSTFNSNSSLKNKTSNHWVQARAGSTYLKTNKLIFLDQVDYWLQLGDLVVMHCTTYQGEKKVPLYPSWHTRFSNYLG